MPDFYTGTSGYVYPHWRGAFYPADLPQAKWLGFYSQHFSTVELNNPFYRLPSEAAFARWRESTPVGFVFAVKASRFITHVKRLKDVAQPLENFLSRARALGPKLGPLLYQLPPNMSRKDELLKGFLPLLPPGLRHVLEFRHSSWFHPGVLEILRKHKVGFCVMDMVGYSCPVEATADFAYFRFHGPSGLYAGCYSDRGLASWARRVLSLTQEVKAVYIYFNNDIGGYAIANALTLARLLKEGSASSG